MNEILYIVQVYMFSLKTLKIYIIFIDWTAVKIYRNPMTDKNRKSETTLQPAKPTFSR